VPGGDCSGLAAAASAAVAMLGWTGNVAAAADGASRPVNRAETASTTPVADTLTSEGRRMRTNSLLDDEVPGAKVTRAYTRE
jgi:hypothetical protein